MKVISEGDFKQFAGSNKEENLFGEKELEGWDTYGNEVKSDIKL